jgi:GNAT superfamily N-acetyltransferase
MLIVRCPVGAAAAAHELERHGFHLMDTLVYFKGETAHFDGRVSSSAIPIRPFRQADLAPLERTAREAFTGFKGHYHADERLDPAAATEGYVERFLRSTRDPRFGILVAELEARPVGFLTLRRESDAAEIELNAVAPAAQGRGIYDAMVKAAGLAARTGGAAHLTVSTPISNVAPQRVWVRNGLNLEKAFYTFHGWFDR